MDAIMGISDRFARRTDSALRTGARGAGRGRLLGGGIAVAAAGALAATALAGAGPALAAGQPATGVTPAAAATPPAVGGYVDSKGNTDGLLAFPAF
jgi:hypothetical protein